MKKNSRLSILLLVCLSFMIFQCEDDLTQEDEKTELNSLKTEIEDLTNSSICNETFECKFIGFGSKPCGGPSGFLIYTTSIDTEKLENLIKIYNQKEIDFNGKWGLLSDCSVPSSPVSINCENNTCVAVY